MEIRPSSYSIPSMWMVPSSDTPRKQAPRSFSLSQFLDDLNGRLFLPEEFQHPTPSSRTRALSSKHLHTLA